MSEPTLVFPPDASESPQDASLYSTTSLPDSESLRRLLGRSSASDKAPADGQPESSKDADEPDTAGDFSFSFNEEDLIPKKTSWSGNYRNDFYEPVVDPADLSDSSSTFYSRAPDLPADSKITVQRTLYVSEQQKAAQQNGAAAKPPSRLTRTQSDQNDVEVQARPEKKAITNFARKQRPARMSENRLDGPDEPRKPRVVVADGAGAARDKSAAAEDRSSHREEKVSSFRRTRSLLGRRNKAQPPESRQDRLNGSAPGTPPRNPSPSKRPMTPMLKTLSNPSFSSFGLSGRRSTEIPPMPPGVDADKYRGSSAARKKDELWSAFRSLDSDASKFLSKAAAQKVSLVRGSLFTFLRTYASHPSNLGLRAEDLDRRTSILNKWWTGLLDLLSPKNYQHVSGSDRPLILNALTMIMERPEWRTWPSTFAPLAERSQAAVPDSHPQAIAETSDFLLESVHHNIRNMFMQNIFAQVAFVVEKMSMKTTPVSLTAFCGKTCAYAFFFCPGIADILVRLWDVRPQNIQRILKASGMRRGSKLPDFSNSVAVNFPPSVRHLAFSSLKGLTTSLKDPPTPPLGVDHVDWQGHWVHRWSGGDSDLFYVFAKNFHILASDFLPHNASREEQLSAPGMLLVHAQLLNNLDTTIHRSTLQTAADGNSNSAPTTFDTLLAADDASAAVQMVPANSARLVGENRLILLLRDMLAVPGWPAMLFAESFCSIMKAAAESTSLYNHDSCFTLCDFLQEALSVLIKYEVGKPTERQTFDWAFWLSVMKRMVWSQSTTTEIRLYSLLFSAWNDLTAKRGWKLDLCFDFLLDKSHFHRTFNHWCPMVRAYFMRLICWRIARIDGDATEADVKVVETLHARLLTVWSHFKYLSSEAKSRNQVRPSTAPCNPAPGRKLLIIRTDTPLSSSFMMFDNLTLSGSSNDGSRPDSPPMGNGLETTTASNGSFLERLTSSLESLDSPKKRGNLFRSLLGYKSADSPARSESPRPDSDKHSSPRDSPLSSKEHSPERNGNNSRMSMYEQRPPLPPKSVPGQAKVPAKTFQQAFFKFSLEAVDRRPHNLPTDIVLDIPRLPLAAQSLLMAGEDAVHDADPQKPTGDAALESRYAGRALAEWTWVVNECQNFFERRRKEGVPSNKQVETPTLGVENFRKPG